MTSIFSVAFKFTILLCTLVCLMNAYFPHLRMVVYVFVVLMICIVTIKCYIDDTQFLCVAMSKNKKKEKVYSKQFRWLPPMHTTMLTLLAKEAIKGNQPSNTFKAWSFATIAKAISA